METQTPRPGYVCYLVANHVKNVVKQKLKLPMSSLSFFVMLEVVDAADRGSYLNSYQLRRHMLLDSSRMNKVIRGLIDDGMVLLSGSDQGLSRKPIEPTRKARDVVRAYDEVLRSMKVDSFESSGERDVYQWALDVADQNPSVFERLYKGISAIEIAHNTSLHRA